MGGLIYRDSILLAVFEVGPATDGALASKKP
jgi:hypothetical protein